MRPHHYCLMMSSIALLVGVMLVPSHLQGQVGFCQTTMRPIEPSPDAAFTGKIVFAQKEQGHLRIYRMNSDGTDLHKISWDNTSLDDYAPVWSPDGSRIAFTSIRQSGTGYELDLNEMTDDGFSQATLYREAGESGTSYDVSWSPDNRHLAFAHSEPGKSAQIYLFDPIDSQVFKHISYPLPMHQPAWSPDGKHILFVADLFSSLDEIDLDGSHDILLVAGNTDQHVFCPVWSPDGKCIAYEEGAGSSYNITVLNINSGQSKTVLDSARNADGLQSSCPQWTVDGQFLLFSSNRDDIHAQPAANKYGTHNDLYAVRVTSPHDVQRLTYTQAFPAAFSWVPDWSLFLPPTPTPGIISYGCEGAIPGSTPCDPILATATSLTPFP